MIATWKESYDKPRQGIEKQRHHFANKGLQIQTYGFSSSHVWMWESDHKEDWVPKSWCLLTVVQEKTLESPLDSKEIKPVHPKGNQPWVFTGRTDAEVEAPVLWPPDVNSWLIGKDPDTGQDGRQKDLGVPEGEMVSEHHLLNGHEFEQTVGNSEDREAWHATVHGVTKSWTQLSDWTTTT